MLRKLSIVVPIFNEVKTLEEILRRVHEAHVQVDGRQVEKEIILIDDASTDGTRDLLKKYNHPPYRVFLQERNQGKGAAVKRGLYEVTGDVVLIQDADLEYNPAEYDALVAPIVAGKADVVYGSRFLNGRPGGSFYGRHYLGNKFLTFISNLFTGLGLSDMETCYKVMKSECVEAVRGPITAKRFGIEPEITAFLAAKKFRVREIPITYAGRQYSEGKKIGWKDAVSALYYIVRSFVVTRSM